MCNLSTRSPHLQVTNNNLKAVLPCTIEHVYSCYTKQSFNGTVITEHSNHRPNFSKSNNMNLNRLNTYPSNVSYHNNVSEDREDSTVEKLINAVDDFNYSYFGVRCNDKTNVDCAAVCTGESTNVGEEMECGEEGGGDDGNESGGDGDRDGVDERGGGGVGDEGAGDEGAGCGGVGGGGGDDGDDDNNGNGEGDHGANDDDSENDDEDNSDDNEDDDNIHRLIALSNLDLMQFGHFASSEGSDVLDNYDPDGNVMDNLYVKSTEYFHQENFQSMLSNSDSDFTVLLHNIRSIPRNLDSFSLQHLLPVQAKVDILGMCETRLSEDIQHMYNIEGYSLFTNNRNHQGGGVCFFVKCFIKCKVLDSLSIMNDCFESLFIECNLNNKSYIFGIIYRRPDSSLRVFNELFEPLLNEVAAMKTSCFLLGDFNIDLLKHEQNGGVREYVNTMFERGFYSCINKPTRNDLNHASIIDHIWCNDLNIQATNGILLTDVSDHFAPFITCSNIQSGVQKETTIRFRDFKSVDSTILNENLTVTLHNFLIDHNNSNASFGKFIHEMVTFIDEHMPWKTVTISNKILSKPWITTELAQNIKERHKMYRKFVGKPITHGDEYRRLRNTVNNRLATAKKEYYKSKLNLVAGNSKKTWSLINEILNVKKKTTTIDEISIDGTKVSNPYAVCNHFNSYFSSVGKELADALPDCPLSPTHYLTDNFPDFELNPTTPLEVNNVIKELKESSPGCDGIPARAIKLLADTISPLLSKLINLSFREGCFPDELKMAKIIPIYKGGDRMLVSNYRPISILPVISKIIERLVYNRLFSFLTNNNILIDQQFGFRKSFSPQLAILELLKGIQDASNEGFYTVGVFLDLRKAFDTIDHNILLKKLEYYGSRNVSLKWFSSYLSNRQQFTEINGIQSTCATVQTGVPQGSTLGPLLFLLYINDIVHASYAMRFILFADDTNAYYSGSNLELVTQIMNRELKNIYNWLLANKLSINLDKTHFIIFAGKKHIPDNIDIKIGNTSIERVFSTKFLGILIDSQITWKNHIQYIRSKLCKIKGILCKIKQNLTKEARKTIYYSLMYPYLQYCNIAWGSAQNAIINPLVIIQKKTVRLLDDADYYAHTNPIFKELQIMKLDDIYKAESLKFVYDCINSNVKSAISFKAVRNVHNFNIRTKTLLRPPKPKTELDKRSISYLGCINWNELPSTIKTSTSKIAFKSQLKKFLISKY